MADKFLYVVDARETLLLSWGRDLFSFGTLAGTAWLCNTQMPPSGWINALIVVLWFMWMMARAKRHMTHLRPDDARAWLDENYPPNDAP